MGKEKELPLWIVQRAEFVPSSGKAKWEDVLRRQFGDPLEQHWFARDAAAAFKLAVLDNEHERLESTSYRVLPYSGGMTFNLSVNVDATVHENATVHGNG